MRASLLKGKAYPWLLRGRAFSPYGYGVARANGAFQPAPSSSSSRKESTQGGVKVYPSLGPFLAAGALSISFAASSYSVAAAKELTRSDLIPKEVILYQYEACPFCNKVRAFLDYHNIPYRVVEVNPMGKKELKWSEYKKVPVLMVDGQQLNDSTGMLVTLICFLMLILDARLHNTLYEEEDAQHLESQHKKFLHTAAAIISALNERLTSGAGTASTESLEEQETWRRWVDEHLVHVLSPNIYRSPSEALESFEYITTAGNFTTMERLMAKYAGATAMYFISKRLKKRHNITDERAALYDAADQWVKGLKDRSFMGGSKPNLADLAVFGVLRPLRNLTAGKEMMANTGIGPWYTRMEAEVGESSRVKE